jgi:hypothetical protein
VSGFPPMRGSSFKNSNRDMVKNGVPFAICKKYR